METSIRKNKDISSIDGGSLYISKDIRENVARIEGIFSGCGDVVKKKLHLPMAGGEGDIYILYIDGLCNNEFVSETIIKPLTWEWRDNVSPDLMNLIWEYGAQTADITKEDNFDNAVWAAMKGDTAVFVSGATEALIVSTKKFPLRGIDESSVESGMRGARDSFNEGFRTSTALIRRRIRDTGLKVEQGVIGRRSRTDYALMYIEDLTEKELLDDIRERISAYEIDAIYDSAMAEHLMEKKWYNPFPVFQSTTRPDKAAAAIADGRVAIVCDNSPEVLLVPATMNTLFQTADDYYNRWPVAVFARIIRYAAAFIAIFLPGIYIALTCFEREMLPDKLLYAIANARSNLSFPIVVEVLIMELLFELLREAGIRLPEKLGNTIGVVGGLIVGQAAVEAGIVSTIVVIVVALAAIASFAIPNEAFASIFRLFKFVAIIFGALFGIFGCYILMMFLIVYLSGIESFGVPYLSPLISDRCDTQAYKDFVLRAPIISMFFRPEFADRRQRVRLRRRSKGGSR